MMSRIQPFLAQETLPVDMIPASWQKMNATTRDILIILGAVTLVTALALLWAVAFRSRRRSKSKHHHHHHPHRHHQTSEQSATPAVSEEEPVESSSRRRRRHRRREHRPRNPTLAETGGLPPLRSAPPPEP